MYPQQLHLKGGKGNVGTLIEHTRSADEGVKSRARHR